jgi:voltage-gated potassium channel Kch
MSTVDEPKPIVINANYEIFILILVIFSLFNTLLIISPFQIITIQPQAEQIIWIIDSFICLILLADFFRRLIKAKSKRNYLFKYYGVLDFFGSLPVPGLRAARLLSTILRYRKLRSSDLQTMEQVIVQKRAESTLLSAILIALMVFELGSIAILNAEVSSPQANIKTASDALWWSYVTVATVGYGDRFPVTNSGRIVGIFVMTVGVGLFSVITSFLADWFRRPRKAVAGGIVPSNDQVANGPIKDAAPGLSPPNASIAEVRRLIDEQEAAYLRNMSELRDRLAEIEEQLLDEN